MMSGEIGATRVGFCFLMLFFFSTELKQIRSCGVVGRVPTFQSGGPGRFPAGSGILISVLGLGVCPSYVFCPVLSLAEALTLC